MKAVYPTIFTKTEEGYLVEVPDMQILTEGKNLQNAIEMERDAIGIKGICMEDDQEAIPEASSREDINISECTFADEGEGFISMVDINFSSYRRKLDNESLEKI